MRSFFPSSSPALLQCWFSAALLHFSKIPFPPLLLDTFSSTCTVLSSRAGALSFKGFGWKPESGHIFQQKVGFVPSDVIVGSGGARQKFLIQELGLGRSSRPSLLPRLVLLNTLGISPAEQKAPAAFLGCHPGRDVRKGRASVFAQVVSMGKTQQIP